MKFLYHHRTKSRDGQAVHIRELIAALRARDHAVVEWALSQGDAGDMGSEGGLAGRLLARLPRVAYELGEHAYGPLAARRLTRVGRREGVDVLYERHALNNTAGLRASRALDVPFLLEVNSPLAHERSVHETLVLQGWADAVERRVLRAADKVLCVTRVLADMLVADGLDAARVEVIPNGVDLSLYGEAGRAPGEGLVIGFTGFFRPWHGLEALVDAMADGQFGAEARLLLVGDGPSRPELQALASRRGVSERLEITGAVERQAIPGQLRRMDICMQPAATAWASPLKLFEYMAAGKAIVAPDQPNLREVLTHGRDALLFPPGVTAGLAEAVARLAGDASLRAELGRGARARIEACGLTAALYM